MNLPRIAVALTLVSTAACGAASDTPGPNETAGAAAQPQAEVAPVADGAAAAYVPAWAQWPMPNGPNDVRNNGAPHKESYTDNGDGTVTDDVTGLVWQQVYTQPTVQPKAYGACKNLTLGGRTGWRLPSLIELLSIVDYYPIPSINTTFFPGIDSVPIDFWSATLVAGDTTSAYVVSFFDGTTYTGATTGKRAYRCVLSPTTTGAGHYQLTADTVYDVHTGLTWQRAASSSPHNEAGAKNTCANLTLGGLTWRLPTVPELMTLVEVSQTAAPLIDPKAFPATPAGAFWSVTMENPPEGQSHYAVTFAAAGLVVGQDNATKNNVRCVH